MRINLDFETYSECDIRRAGAWAYSAHPSTRVICMAFAVDAGAPEVLTEDELGTMPDIFNDPRAEFHAWNSFFEFAIWSNVLGWRLPPLERWYDTAAAAAACALPRSLGECGAVLDLPDDMAKQKRGRYLIQRLSKPQRDGARCRDPELLSEMYEYCQRDVIAEREIGRKIPPLSEKERRVWLLDQEINTRGVFVDRQGVKTAIEILKGATERLEGRVVEVSDGELTNVRQIQRVATFCESRGVRLESLTKQHVAETLTRDDLPPEVRGVLELRQQLGQSSTAKFEALNNLIQHVDDDRARGLLRYHGASTGRWSGNNFQPQNLPRGEFNDITAEDYRDERPAEALDWLEALYGCPMSALSSSIRSVISAPSGRRLIVADYSAIEARVLPWLAGQSDVLDVFRGHGKIYEYTASQIYRKPIEAVTKEERFVGKVATLALGYQGGAKAFRAMAEGYGVDIPDELAETVKHDWRHANRNVVAYWYAVERAAVDAVNNPGEVFRCRSIAFKRSGDFLMLRLPSQRLLRYYRPELREGKFGREQVCFEGRDSVTGKWRRQFTYGGKLVENITQATARDIMVGGMFAVARAGYDIVLTVHDELIAEADEGFGTAEEVERLMCDAPDWARGLPLRAEGFEAKRYRK